MPPRLRSGGSTAPRRADARAQKKRGGTWVVVHRVAHLRVVERREAERILRGEVAELHVELATRHQLAAHQRRVHAVLPALLHRDVSAVTLQRMDQVGRHLVTGLEPRVVERHLRPIDDVVLAAGIGGLRIRVHEGRLAVGELQACVLGTAGVALAPRVGALLRVVAGVVAVLVIDVAERAGAAALHVPHVHDLAGARRVLVAVGLALADVARDHAAVLLEAFDRVVDGPEHRPLVLVVDVVVAARVLGVDQLLPRAVGLPLVRTSADRVGRVVVLHQHVERIARVHGLQRRRGRAFAPEVLAPGKIDRQRLGRLPGQVRAAEHRRNQHLAGDERVGRNVAGLCGAAGRDHDCGGDGAQLQRFQCHFGTPGGLEREEHGVSRRAGC